MRSNWSTRHASGPRPSHPRRAGVSAFGVSGTNAHLILEQGAAIGAASPATVRPARVPWLVSGRGDAALEAQIERIRAAAADLSPVDVGYSLLDRAIFARRAVLIGDTVVRGTAADHAVGILFSGQGSQRAGMGRGLYARFPVFAAAFDAVTEHLGDVDWDDLDQTGNAQLSHLRGRGRPLSAAGVVGCPPGGRGRSFGG
nr:hypothetical protein GCM10020092_031820 [Actinoplanes digitatis]